MPINLFCDYSNMSHGFCHDLKGESIPYAWSGQVSGENFFSKENSMSKDPGVEKSLMLLRN